MLTLAHDCCWAGRSAGIHARGPAHASRQNAASGFRRLQRGAPLRHPTRNSALAQRFATDAHRLGSRVRSVNPRLRLLSSFAHAGASRERPRERGREREWPRPSLRFPPRSGLPACVGGDASMKATPAAFMSSVCALAPSVSRPGGSRAGASTAGPRPVPSAARPPPRASARPGRMSAAPTRWSRRR